MNYSDIHMDFADRAYEVSCAHPKASFHGDEYMKGLKMYTEFMEGKTSLVMVASGGVIHMRYIPIERTRWIFDCYAT